MCKGVMLTDKMCWTRTAGQSPHVKIAIETARSRMLNTNLNLRMPVLYTIRNPCGMIAAYVSEPRGHHDQYF